MVSPTFGSKSLAVKSIDFENGRFILSRRKVFVQCIRIANRKNEKMCAPSNVALSSSQSSVFIDKDFA